MPIVSAGQYRLRIKLPRCLSNYSFCSRGLISWLAAWRKAFSEQWTAMVCTLWLQSSFTRFITILVEINRSSVAAEVLMQNHKFTTDDERNIGEIPGGIGAGEMAVAGVFSHQTG